MKLFLPLLFAVLLLTLTVCSSVNGQQQQQQQQQEEEEVIVVSNDIINDYDESESLVTVIEPQIEEPVCPFDYILLRSSIDDSSARSDGDVDVDVDEEGVIARRKRRQLQQQESSSPPIQIIRQADDDSYVEFTIQNTTSWLDDNLYDDLLPKHIFTTLETGPFGSQHCIMDENLPSSSGIMKAHCFGDANFATIRIYVRYSTADTAIGDIIAGSSKIMDIPKCCQDPYASSNNDGDYAVIGYVYKLKCTPSCDNPEEYFDGETNGTSDDDDDDDETDDLITISPSASPTTMGSLVPTTMLSSSPTETQVEDCSASKKESSLLRDKVSGSLLNGPHWGSRHGWAWPAASNSGCTRYATVDDIGSGANAWPCYVNKQLLNRILQFKSSYFDINFEVDNGMKIIITLPDGMGTDTVSLYPSGGGGSAATTAACTPPNDYKWNDYPLRLVRSGRYLHHWYAETVGCNGATSASGGDTRIEIKVTPDCDEARFNIQIPDGMPGILPITIAGVGSSDSFPTSLLGRPEGKMWRYVSGSWKEFGVGGNYQLEKDVVDNSYTFVYSLSLEFESDPVGDCEQFYFGVAAPSDSNPSCDAP